MAIIGAILGDIAGSKWEFGRPDNLDWKNVELFSDENRYTDDTVLSIATKYAIENHIPCFLESENYESFLRNVLSLKCDTDTLGAIGGGIAEEFYKGTGFNNEYILQKYLDNRLFELISDKL